MSLVTSAGELQQRALAWRRAQRQTVCDVLAPWEHGRVAFATRFPTYFDFNSVVVERPTGLDAAELAAVADELMAGMAHRRIEFEIESEARRLAPGFAALGWRTFGLVMMHFEGDPPAPGDTDVAEVGYDEVEPLRRAWHEEDFPGMATDYMADAREVSQARGVRVLAARHDGEPIGFAQLELAGDGVEIEDVYVLPAHRGRGVGGAMTAAAMRWAVALGRRDIWIVADADGRPHHLYERLGFVPVWTWSEFLLAA